MTKTQDSVTYKRAKRLALSQQLTTRLICKDKTACQTWIINNKKDPQKKHVSKNLFTGGLKLVLWYQPYSYFWCESRKIDSWFTWKPFSRSTKLCTKLTMLIHVKMQTAVVIITFISMTNIQAVSLKWKQRISLLYCILVLIDNWNFTLSLFRS